MQLQGFQNWYLQLKFRTFSMIQASFLFQKEEFYEFCSTLIFGSNQLIMNLAVLEIFHCNYLFCHLKVLEELLRWYGKLILA